MNIKPYISTLIYCLVMSGGSVLAGDFTYVENLLNAKQYNKAWQQLQKLKELEGDPKYDYLYGVAAFEVGDYKQAVFALDRVTVVSPNDVNARLYLARTYYKLNNHQAAHKQLRELQKLQHTVSFDAKTNKEIARLAGGKNIAKKANFSGIASLTVGYSNNSNLGLDKSSIDSPLLGAVELTPSLKRKKSGFTQAKLRLNYQKPLSEHHIWFSSLELWKKKFQTDSHNDLSTAKLKSGLLIQQGRKQYDINIYTRPVYLDKDYFSNMVGVGAAFSYQLNKKQKIKVALAQENHIGKKYSDQSRKRTSLLASYSLKQKKTRHNVSLFLTKGAAKVSAGDQYVNDIAQLSYGNSHRWTPKNLSFVNVSYKVGKHQGVDPIYSEHRKDHDTTFNIGHEYRVSKKTTAYFDIEYTDRKSNLSLYNTDRSQVSTGIAFQF